MASRTTTTVPRPGFTSRPGDRADAARHDVRGRARLSDLVVPGADVPVGMFGPHALEPPGVVDVLRRRVVFMRVLACRDPPPLADGALFGSGLGAPGASGSSTSSSPTSAARVGSQRLASTSPARDEEPGLPTRRSARRCGVTAGRGSSPAVPPDQKRSWSAYSPPTGRPQGACRSAPSRSRTCRSHPPG
jgi:hypothetical protein